MDAELVGNFPDGDFPLEKLLDDSPIRLGKMVELFLFLFHGRALRPAYSKKAPPAPVGSGRGSRLTSANIPRLPF